MSVAEPRPLVVVDNFPLKTLEFVPFMVGMVTGGRGGWEGQCIRDFLKVSPSKSVVIWLFYSS